MNYKKLSENRRMLTTNIVKIFLFLKQSFCVTTYLNFQFLLVKIAVSITPEFPGTKATNRHSENVSQVNGRHKLPGGETHRGKEEKISEPSLR